MLESSEGDASCCVTFIAQKPETVSGQVWKAFLDEQTKFFAALECRADQVKTALARTASETSSVVSDSAKAQADARVEVKLRRHKRRVAQHLRRVVLKNESLESKLQDVKVRPLPCSFSATLTDLERPVRAERENRKASFGLFEVPEHAWRRATPADVVKVSRSSDAYLRFS